MSTQETLHDINSSINALEQGFFLLSNGQLEDPALKDKLIQLMAENTNKLKQSWAQYKKLEDVPAT